MSPKDDAPVSAENPEFEHYEPQPLDREECSLLRQGMLFSSLDEDQFQEVVNLARVVAVDRNRLLFVQNQAANHFFVLANGQIKLTRRGFDDSEKVIDVIQPGQSFAEAVILSEDELYPVNAQAITESRVIAIEASHYLGLLKQSTDLCLSVMARMGQRMHWLINEIDRLVLHNATFRLVSYLLDQLGPESEEQSEFRLKTPKTVIASRLSIVPETLSRTLKKLTLKGLVDYQRDGTIVLRDIPELRRLITLELTDNSTLEHDGLGKCPRL